MSSRLPADCRREVENLQGTLMAGIEPQGTGGAQGESWHSESAADKVPDRSTGTSVPRAVQSACRIRSYERRSAPVELAQQFRSEFRASDSR